MYRKKKRKVVYENIKNVSNLKWYDHGKIIDKKIKETPIN